METSSSAGSLEEYQQQLAEIDELLSATPGDETLLSLKRDLLELIALTRNELASAGVVVPPPPPPPAVVHEPAAAAAAWGGEEQESAIQGGEEAPATAVTENGTVERPKKKSHESLLKKEFEIPSRFLPLDTDTEAEANKKKRAIKSLKRQYHAAKKEAESDKKQKSWQSFQKKKKLNKDGSIFSTHDDDQAKIGVVTRREKTSFTDRTRHK